MQNSSSAIDIPTAHPELDRLLVPLVTGFTVDKSADSDPNRTPAYPSVHELPRDKLLLSENDVKAYRDSFLCIPCTDSSLRDTGADIKSLVADIFNAMIDTKYCLDHKQSKAYTDFGPNKKRGQTYPTKLIAAVSWKLMRMLMDGTVNGFVKSKDEQQLKEAVGRKIPSLIARHRELCIALRLEKAVAHDVLTVDEQIWVNLIFAPGAYAVVKSTVRCGREGMARRSPRTADKDVYMPSTAARSSSNNLDISQFYQDDRISHYARFDRTGSSFLCLSYDEAETYLNECLPRLPPQPDAFLEMMKGAKPYLVMKLYEAMRNVTEVQNIPHSADYKRFVAFKSGKIFTPRTSPTALMEACWRILDFFLDGVENGFFLPYNKPDQKKEVVIVSHSDNNCARRFASMLEILKREKTVCWKFLKSNHDLDEFVYQPYEFSDYRCEVHVIDGWLRAYPFTRQEALTMESAKQRENEALHALATTQNPVSADAAAFMDELRAGSNAHDDDAFPPAPALPSDDADAEEQVEYEETYFASLAPMPEEQVEYQAPYFAPPPALMPEDQDVDESQDDSDANVTAFSGGFAANGNAISAVEVVDWDMDQDEGDSAEIPIDPALETTTAGPPDGQMDWAAVGVEPFDIMDMDYLTIDSAHPHPMAPDAMVEPEGIFAQHEEDDAEELEDVDELFDSCTLTASNTDEDGQVTIN